MPPIFHRGSCLCDSYELRVTQRCLVEDLGLAATADFAEARKHQIVSAFERQRSGNPLGTKTVGPAAGDATVYRLAHGDDRGATFYDKENRVVWLCACRRHRSGDPEDAFPYFHELINAGRIEPTEKDLVALLRDRSRRFVETLAEDAQALLERARSNPGVEHAGLLGGEQLAGVAVDIVEVLEETYVAFSVRGMDYGRLLLILGAFYPDATFKEWELVAALPTRALSALEGEVCYRILRGR